tara:strand:+ start:48 stop:260 length:213 start_codon:yes stop_codon:yes gene_type:complete
VDIAVIVLLGAIVLALKGKYLWNKYRNGIYILVAILLVGWIIHLYGLNDDVLVGIFIIGIVLVSLIKDYN